MTAYRKPSPPPPQREREPKKGTRVRMAETPEEIEARERAEKTSFLRAESRALAGELERERVLFDRQLRVVGVLLTIVGAFLVSLTPLTVRAAGAAGIAVAVGPLLAALGGQGATRAENVPVWLKSLYAGAAILGIVFGSLALT